MAAACPSFPAYKESTPTAASAGRSWRVQSMSGGSRRDVERMFKIAPMMRCAKSTNEVLFRCRDKVLTLPVPCFSLLQPSKASSGSGGGKLSILLIVLGTRENNRVRGQMNKEYSRPKPREGSECPPILLATESPRQTPLHRRAVGQLRYHESSSNCSPGQTVETKRNCEMKLCGGQRGTDGAGIADTSINTLGTEGSGA